ncbi:hypothetical protein PR048_022212 [Dryococelus australis]|uniref:Uncharacterized protein n=1 Tax=Dryococelus australis TaxID=614101 RepID=A0ABQ9H0F4_9NEOP|nr:hypothetical protein PR048_022212 [Dryococelus australis]
MEQRQNAKGEGGSPTKPADQRHIVRHDSNLRKSGSDPARIEPGSPWWEASGLNRHDGNTARLACRSYGVLAVRVSVARIAPSLLDFARTAVYSSQDARNMATPQPIRWLNVSFNSMPCATTSYLPPPPSRGIDLPMSPNNTSSPPPCAIDPPRPRPTSGRASCPNVLTRRKMAAERERERESDILTEMDLPTLCWTLPPIAVQGFNLLTNQIACYLPVTRHAHGRWEGEQEEMNILRAVTNRFCNREKREGVAILGTNVADRAAACTGYGKKTKIRKEGQREESRTSAIQSSRRKGTPPANNIIMDDIMDRSFNIAETIKIWKIRNSVHGKQRNALKDSQCKNTRYLLCERADLAAQRSDDVLGVYVNNSPGQCRIIMNACGKMGFIPAACLIYNSISNTSEYHKEMNYENCCKWLSSTIQSTIADKILNRLQPTTINQTYKDGCEKIINDLTNK